MSRIIRRSLVPSVVVAIVMLCRVVLGDVVINEIMYNPSPDQGADDEYEFVELYNNGDDDVDLTGWSFDVGIHYTFPTYVLPARSYLVLCRNQARVSAYYGIPNVIGDFEGSLENAGEWITLVDASPIPQVVDEVRYNDRLPWPQEPDGNGPSLELLDPSSDNTLFSNWGPSLASAAMGTPGDENSQYNPLPPGANVVINEIMYHPLSAEQKEKFIELVNVGSEEAPLDGWQLVGEVSYAFPPTATVLPGEYAVVAADAKWMFINHGLPKIFGDFQGLTSTGGQSIALRAPNGVIVDYVDFRDNDPWPILPDGEGPSLELINPYDDNDFGRNWTEGSLSSPGRQNDAFSLNNAPYITKAAHSPLQPIDSDSVIISAKVRDADGLSSVWVAYQVVLPGQYIRISDFAYQTSWLAVDMNDQGLDGDLAAADGIYTATLPPQLHRTLLRYIVYARDASPEQKIARAPAESDPSMNYACFVYNGVPPYYAETTYLGHPRTHSVLTKLPVYHLIADADDVLECEYKGISFWDRANRRDFRWRGTFVYEGEVYDHIAFRLRGGVHRYHQHKRAYKLKFNRGRRFQMKDNYGEPYPYKRKKLNLNSNIQQVWTGKRGEEGMYESLGYRLFRDAGVNFANTTWVHLRIIDDADEAGSDQYKGDFYGIFTEIEQPDDNLLKTHGHPLTGNLYKIDTGADNGRWEKEVNTIPPLDDRDIQEFWDGYHSSPGVQWWRDNFDLESWYSYHAIVLAIDHTDIPAGKNYYYYRNPETNLWKVFPWDLDLTFDVPYGGGDGPFVSPVLGAHSADFGHEYKNRLRDIVQLIYTEEHVFPIIDEWRDLIIEMTEADRDRWDQMPLPDPYPFQSQLEQTPWQNLFESLDYRIAGLKSWIVTRRESLISQARDTNIPLKPFNQSPAHGSEAQGIPLLVSSSYSDPNANAHIASRWILIKRDGDWAYPLWDSGEDPMAKISIVVPLELFENLQWYEWRVKHKDATGRWSEWSDPTSFQSLIISDPTPPTSPLGPTARTPDYHTVILSWGAADDAESGILGYEINRDGQLLTTGLIDLSYTDTTVHENTSYDYEILAINGGGTRSFPVQITVTTLQDNVAPTAESAEVIAQNKVRIVFDEPVDPDSATDPANYRMTSWLSVMEATLQPDARTVELTTALMSDSRTYRLTINNITDASSARNPLPADTSFEFIASFDAGISEVSLSTGNSFLIGFFYAGNYVYSDWLEYTITSPIPQELSKEAIQIRLPCAPDADRNNQSSEYLSFNISFDAEVWVGFRINETLPAWLADGTWEFTGFTQHVDKSGGDRYHDFYKKRFPRGKVVLGGNAQPPASVHSNYIVVVRPLSSANPDADLDALPDDWETAWFGNVSRQPMADEDLDGRTNFEEFVTGTNPLDPSSFFEIGVLTMNDGQIELTWPTALYKYYQVYTADSPGGEWRPLGLPRDSSKVPAVEDISSFKERYYRVEVW